MVLRPRSRRADQLADLLDGRAQSSEVAPAILALGMLAQQLRAVPLAPTPLFRDALRSTLMHGAGSAGASATGVTHAVAAAPAAATGAHRVLTAAKAVGGAVSRGAGGASQALTPIISTSLAGTLAATVGLSGIAIGASRAIPGDLLYGLKSSTESAEMALTRGTVDKALLRLSFGQARLREARELLRRHPLGTAGSISAAVAADLQRLLDEWAADTAVASPVLTWAARLGSLQAREALTLATATSRDTMATVLQVVGPGPFSFAAGALTYLGKVQAALGTPLPYLLPSSVSAPGGVTGIPGMPGTTSTSPLGTPKLPGQPGGPSVPGGPVLPTGVPGGPTSVPTVPGGPTSIPTIPGGPTSIPTIPGGPTSIPTIPGGPTSIPTIPGGPTSIPTIPGGPTSVPTVPGVPGVPNVPVPSVTAPPTNVPTNGGIVPTLPANIPTVPVVVPTLPVPGGLSEGIHL